MGELTRVTIDFDESHLVFPRLIAIVLCILALAALYTHRNQIAGSFGYWRQVFTNMDRARFFGALLLTIVYFSLMVPVGNVWPNTGMGFLVCSIPFVFLSGLVFMHDRQPGQILVVAAVALIAPTLVWWLFTDLFFLTLP